MPDFQDSTEVFVNPLFIFVDGSSSRGKKLGAKSCALKDRIIKIINSAAVIVWNGKIFFKKKIEALWSFGFPNFLLFSKPPNVFELWKNSHQPGTFGFFPLEIFLLEDIFKAFYII